MKDIHPLNRLPLAEANWAELRAEAEAQVEREPLLSHLVQTLVLSHQSLEEAVAARLALVLGSDVLSATSVRSLTLETLARDEVILRALCRDLITFQQRDPACPDMLTPFLFHKGFLALQVHRVGHWLWCQGRKALAVLIQHEVSIQLGVDIHPGAMLGEGILLDHATGVVIGETAVVDDDVSLMHGVTLGGTGKQSGARHPIIRRGVLIGAGASIIGRIEVGERSKVGVGTVLLKDVPAHVTVAGVPGVVITHSDITTPSREMSQI